MQIGKYRQIVQNILGLIQEYAYKDQKVLIKTHKGYVTSNKKPNQDQDHPDRG